MDAAVSQLRGRALVVAVCIVGTSLLKLERLWSSHIYPYKDHGSILGRNCPETSREVDTAANHDTGIKSLDAG